MVYHPLLGSVDQQSAKTCSAHTNVFFKAVTEPISDLMENPRIVMFKRCLAKVACWLWVIDAKAQQWLATNLRADSALSLKLTINVTINVPDNAPEIQNQYRQFAGLGVITP
jgi:hypothetical protein|tara:strand:+ start:169 stop:504 length:336 start_codon:yes stop_codon:yes gene_type:complete